MSSPSFDPYHRWLGIPSSEQPPNHYRLLGLALFEADPEVIDSAAMRQMAHVRSHAIGPYREASQSILNELAEARRTLLDPSLKRTYDESFRRQRENSSAVDTNDLEWVNEQRGKTIHSALEDHAQSTSRKNARSRSSRKRKKQFVPSFVSVPLGGIAGLFLAWLLLKLIFHLDVLKEFYGDRNFVSQSEIQPTERKQSQVKSTISASTPKSAPTAERPIKIDLLETLHRAQSSLPNGWKFSGDTLTATAAARGSTLQLPLPDLSLHDDITILLELENTGRETGAPEFNLDFPSCVGGRLRARYYYGRSAVFAIYPVGKTKDVLITYPTASREAFWGRKELSIHSTEERTTVRLGNVEIGQFDTPVPLSSLDMSNASLVLSCNAGSNMTFRVSKLIVVLN